MITQRRVGAGLLLLGALGGWARAEELRGRLAAHAGGYRVGERELGPSPHLAPLLQLLLGEEVVVEAEGSRLERLLQPEWHHGVALHALARPKGRLGLADDEGRLQWELTPSSSLEELLLRHRGTRFRIDAWRWPSGRVRVAGIAALHQQHEQRIRSWDERAGTVAIQPEAGGPYRSLPVTQVDLRFCDAGTRSEVLRAVVSRGRGKLRRAEGTAQGLQIDPESFEAGALALLVGRTVTLEGVVLPARPDGRSPIAVERIEGLAAVSVSGRVVGHELVNDQGKRLRLSPPELTPEDPRVVAAFSLYKLLRELPPGTPVSVLGLALEQGELVVTHVEAVDRRGRVVYVSRVSWTSQPMAGTADVPRLASPETGGTIPLRELRIGGRELGGMASAVGR